MAVFYRNPDTEADIVSELYYRLRQNGILPRMEVKLPSLITRSRRIKCDLALVANKEIIAAVEVKRKSPSKGKFAVARMTAANLQERAYESMSRNTGIPVFWVRGRKDIQPTVDKLYHLYTEFTS